MYKTSKLKGRIIEKFGSQEAFAKAVNKNKSYISLYLNYKVLLNQKTMDEWIEKLEIPAEEVYDYFFVRKVHETEQEG